MKLVPLEEKHLPQAASLALLAYQEEKRCTPFLLPPVSAMPDLTPFARNGLGIAAFDGDKMLGFWGALGPLDNAFASTARGVFSPMHAHGALPENRGRLYQNLYQAAAKIWIRQKIFYHAISLYAHDLPSIWALFTYGFGQRCADALRPMEPFGPHTLPGLSFVELSGHELREILPLYRLLDEHLGSSPCFLQCPTPEPPDVELSHLWMQNTRFFAARDGKSTIAFLKISESAETFLSSRPDTRNISGAFCLPQYRGQGIMQGLLNHVLVQLRTEGYARLGVDYESFNPSAKFWTKYFTPYIASVVRRIDECAL